MFAGIRRSLNRLFIRNLLRAPIDPYKIVFTNFDGNGYGCNPKYIAEELLKQNYPGKLVWLVDGRNRPLEIGFPEGLQLVDFGSSKALAEVFSAKVFITNARAIPLLIRGLCRKQEQVRIQTWHGSFGIKRVDRDMNHLLLDSDWVRLAKIDSADTNYMISHSRFENGVYRNAMWYNGEILEFGHPRNDIFFGDNHAARAKVNYYLGLNDAIRVALYIPTFRDDNSNYFSKPDHTVLTRGLSERFGGDWAVVTRRHPKMVDTGMRFRTGGWRDATLYDDVQELLARADVVVTDYSSCIFDFMLSRKPGFIYAPDLEHYEKNRGFYYSFTTTPFPLARSNEELLSNILNFSPETYQKRIDEFLWDKGSFESGKASARVVSFIKKIVEGA